MNYKKKEDLTFKIITLGNAGVGKTSIIKRYSYGIFDNNSLPTIGFEFSVKKIKLKNGIEINLKLIDTNGQEKYRALSTSYLKHADGVFFVFALNNKESYDELTKWIEIFNDNNQNIENIGKYIVGNKSDLKEKNINEDEIKDFSKKNGMDYFQTSAKDDINIEKIFQEMGEFLYLNYIKLGRGKDNQIKLEAKSDKKKNKCCQSLIPPDV